MHDAKNDVFLASVNFPHLWWQFVVCVPRIWRTRTFLTWAGYNQKENQSENDDEALCCAICADLPSLDLNRNNMGRFTS